jgi:hypothetical protein
MGLRAPKAIALWGLGVALAGPAFADAEPPAATKTSATTTSAPSTSAPRAGVRSTAFFYAADPPKALFDHFDRVVVEPDHVASPPKGARGEALAYVSIGEVHPSRPFRAELPKGIVVGKNAAWGSEIVDLSRPEWTTFVVDRLVEPLWARGYRGFFLDTLDSHELVAKTEPARAAQRAGIVRIVKAVRARHPEATILLNRGFEIAPELARDVAGIVVEGLFEGHHAGAYRSVDESGTRWLLEKLAAVRALGLPVTVIDYLPPNDRARRRAAAKRILDAGFEPWIATPSLDDVGVGRVEIVPREVLVLHRGSDRQPLAESDAVRLIGPILEHHGLVPNYVDVRRGLPAGELAGRIAGIVSLATEGPGAPPLRAFFERHRARGIRIAFLDGFGFAADGAFLSELDLAPQNRTAASGLAIAEQGPGIGLEAPPRAHPLELPPVRVIGPRSRSRLRLTDAAGTRWDGVVVGSWGGVAFPPYVLSEGLSDARAWVLDPYAFLEEALDLGKIPAPDVTTEGGRRILTAHVDGDAFVSRAERKGNPYTAQVLLEQILAKYPLPHTISVVEAEVGPAGKYPKDSPKLEVLARKIFALPHVELASHTFSHPFYWREAEGVATDPIASDLAHLAIPGYRFDLAREIDGSIRYIDERLAPPGKKTRVLLWSGDCVPSAEAVARTAKAGVLNVNGGGSIRMRDRPSLTRGAPMGVPLGPGAYQVFAPVENENVYTNGFLGPYWGYRRAIETFELEGAPRRLSPVSIYYHFYSAAKGAALSALKEVYDWALGQELTPLFLSSYAEKVLAFQELTIARRVDDGAWEFAGLGALRTVRLPEGFPDLDRSSGVAGVAPGPKGRFVILATDVDRIVLATTTSAPTRPHLVHANGRVVAFEPDGKGARLRVTGEVPLVLTFGAAANCSLSTKSGTVAGKATGGQIRFALDRKDTGEARLVCP